jgi:hypothetical protein
VVCIMQASSVSLSGTITIALGPLAGTALCFECWLHMFGLHIHS